MRVVFLAAGAGGMYCGSCLRDNRLAATLISQGRDVSLIPLYTPLRTDEPGAGLPRVHLGGINVYLKSRWPWMRRLPGWMTGILDHPSVLRSVGKLASNTRPENLGELTVSVLKGTNGPQAAEFEVLIESLAPDRPEFVVLPDLMFLGMSRRIKERLGAKVVCTLGGEDIFLDHLPEPHRSECFRLIREAAGEADAYVGVTQYYGQHCVGHFGLPRGRVHYVPLGVHVDDAPPSEIAADKPSFDIGYLARVCPEKGLAFLCKAFVELRKRGHSCTLHVAGYRATADGNYLDDCRSLIKGQGFDRDYRDHGEVTREEKYQFLRSIDVLSVPTAYPEAKGISILEAMSCGVPVVLPDHGSFPELIRDTGGGALFKTGDVAALADALARLMRQPEQRRQLGLAGYRGVREKYSSRIMADRMWELLEHLR